MVPFTLVSKDFLVIYNGVEEQDNNSSSVTIKYLNMLISVIKGMFE